MPGHASLTYADLETFPDDGLRRELIDGEMFVSPAPKLRHQVISSRLHLALGNHAEEHGGAQVFYAPLDVLFSQRDVVEPDLIVVPDEQNDILTEKHIVGVPALLIEILSENVRYDRVRKRDLYARWGVPRYWIVDPESDRIEVHALDGDRYGKPQIFEAGDTLELDILPGFSLDVAKILRR